MRVAADVFIWWDMTRTSSTPGARRRSPSAIAYAAERGADVDTARSGSTRIQSEIAWGSRSTLSSKTSSPATVSVGTRRSVRANEDRTRARTSAGMSAAIVAITPVRTRSPFADAIRST